MFPNLKLWSAGKRSARAYGRRKAGLRFEPLENRQLLSAVDPIVSAGLIAGPGGVQDLVVTSAAPEVSVDINESGGLITVAGLTQQYLGTDGTYHTVQTDINTSGNYSQTFPASSLRDLKVQLQGVDSFLTIGDPADPVTVGRDLIISMPANTTSAELTKLGIAATSILNLDVDSVTVGRNLTITIGTNSTVGEAAVVDLAFDTVGSTLQKGTLTLKTNGDFPNMIGVSIVMVYGDLSVTTGNGNDFISMADANALGRLTVSAGDGDNSIVLSDAFTEMVDSSLQAFVTCNPIFGDGLGDGELTAPCVEQLAEDFSSGADAGTCSVVAPNLNVYTVGAGNDLIDVHDGIFIGGNVVISATGTGTHVIALTASYIASSAGGTTLGNCTITGGSGDDLVIIDGLPVAGLLSVNTGAGNDVVVATPNVETVADAAITDFVANHPGVFFDGSDPASGNLDIDDLLAEVLDLSSASSFDATKAIFVTKDTPDDASWMDISSANVELTMTVTMGGGDDFLAISEAKVGLPAGNGVTTVTTGLTVTLGNGDDTVIITGVGGRALTDYSNGPPTAEMQLFTLTVGNGVDNVLVTLDYMGDPDDPGGNTGIAGAIDNYAGNNPSVYNSIEAVGNELDFAAETMLDNTANPTSVYADKVAITTGNGGDTVNVSYVSISASTTNRLQIKLGTGDNILYFYDNTWDGYANLSGGGNATTTLDEFDGGNTDVNITVTGFPNIIPPNFI